MTRVTLADTFRDLIAKAEQPDMFGRIKGNPDLVQVKKVVRKKGGAHVQTFYERRDAAGQGAMFDPPTAENAPAPAPKPTPAATPPGGSLLDLLRKPEKAAKPKPAAPPPTGGMFDAPTEAAAPEAAPEPAKRNLDDELSLARSEFRKVVARVTGKPPERIALTSSVSLGDAHKAGIPGEWNAVVREWEHLYNIAEREDEFTDAERLERIDAMHEQVATLEALANEHLAREKSTQPAAPMDREGMPDTTADVPPAVLDYFGRLKVPARRAYAEAVYRELNGGPPATVSPELGHDMAEKIAAKVERFTGKTRAQVSQEGADAAAAHSAKQDQDADARHNVAAASGREFQPIRALTTTVTRGEKAANEAVRFLDNLGKSVGANLLELLTADMSKDFHLFIDPPAGAQSRGHLQIGRQNANLTLSVHRATGALDAAVRFRVQPDGTLAHRGTTTADVVGGALTATNDPNMAHILLMHMSSDGFTEAKRANVTGDSASLLPEAEAPSAPAPAADEPAAAPTMTEDERYEHLRAAEAKARSRALTADRTFADTLQTVYGPKAARDARYYPDSKHTDPRVKAAIADRANAMSEYQELQIALRAMPGDGLSPSASARNLAEGQTKDVAGITYTLRRSKGGAGPLRWFAPDEDPGAGQEPRHIGQFEDVIGNKDAANALHEAIASVAKDGWRGNLMKEREVAHTITKTLLDHGLDNDKAVVSDLMRVAARADAFGAEDAHHPLSDTWKPHIGPVPSPEPAAPRDLATAQADLRQALARKKAADVDAVRHGSTGGSESPAITREIERLKREVSDLIGADQKAALDRQPRRAAEPDPDPEPTPADEPEGASYREDALAEYARQGGRTRDRVDPSTQHVYASTLRPLGSFAPQLTALQRAGTAEVMNRGMGSPKRDERAHSYVFSNDPLDQDIIDAYQLTPVSAPAAAEPAEPEPAEPEAATDDRPADPLTTALAWARPVNGAAALFDEVIEEARNHVPTIGDLQHSTAKDARTRLAANLKELVQRAYKNAGVYPFRRDEISGTDITAMTTWVARQEEDKYQALADAYVTAWRSVAKPGELDYPDDAPAKPGAAPRGPRERRPFGFDAVAASSPTKAVTVRTRTIHNERAVDTARKIKAEGRDAPTPDERAALAAWTGEGGLTGDLNAHYTPVPVAEAMWAALKAAGFEGGRVLEPSVGAGVFIETAPDGVAVTGVEYNPVTGDIAKLLHEPNGHTIHPGMSFEKYNTSSDDAPFDAIIANPPYGSRTDTGQIDKPHIRVADHYFMDTALDRLKDGGLASFLIAPGPFENADSRAFRARMLARADILSIKQLPQSTFQDSNSMVPAIVVTMRKRPHADGLALARMVEKHGEDVLRRANIHDDAILDGKHLTNDPKANILGDWDPQSKGYRYRDVKGTLDSIDLTRLAQGFRPVATPDFDALTKQYGEDAVASARTYAETNTGRIPDGTISEDGKYILRVGESGERRWHTLKDEQPVLDGAIQASASLRAFANAKNNSANPEVAEQQRQSALAAVQAFLDTHGNPHDHRDLRDHVRSRGELAHLLNHVNPDGSIKDSLTTPLDTTPEAPPSMDKDDPRAMASELARRGRLTPKNLALWVSHNSGSIKDERSARAYLDEQFALDVNGRWVEPSDVYGGHVLDKAAAMEAAAMSPTVSPDDRTTYMKQAAHLRSLVQFKSVHEFRATPRDSFVAPEVVAAWINDTYADGEEHYTVRRVDGVTYIDRGRYATGYVGDMEALQKFVNFKLTPDPTKKTRYGQEIDPDKVAEERHANAERAAEEEARFIESFQSWLPSSPHREAVEREYNDRFSGYVEQEISGDALPIENWGGPVLHAYQNQAARHAFAAGNSICALDVGLGKTHVGAALAGMLLQSGRKKVLTVVPKGLFANWRKHLPRDLQGRRVLVIGESENAKGKWVADSGETVAQKLSDAATGNYDVVVITRDWYGRIPIRDENFDRLVDDDIEAKRRAQLAKEGAYKGARTGNAPQTASEKRSARQAEEQAAAMTGKAQKKKFSDLLNGMTFEDMGFDAIIADEAHAYKNLHGVPAVRGSKPKFMGGGAESKRAQDFLFKSILTRERTGGTGIFFLTATPTKNSPLELFNMLKHIDHTALDRMGIPYTDTFVDRYCDARPMLAMGMDGQSLQPATGVLSFRNLRELRGVMGRFIFRRTGADPDIVQQMRGLPERRDIEHTFDLEDDVRTEYRRLADAAREAFGNKEARGADHAFAYMSKMQKITLDPALHDRTFADRPNPRFAKAAEITKDALAEDGKVLMFMDMGKQVGDSSGDDDADPYDDLDRDELEELAAEYGVADFAKVKTPALKKAVRAASDKIAGNAYDRLVQHLVDQGVPRDKIAVVTADTAKSSADRDAIKEAYNRGDIRVVIGSTGVIGEGFSFQRGTTDMIHLDTPWDPGTYLQRLGRAIRQGNTLPFVRNHTLAAKGSYDSLRMAMLAGKKGWSEQLWEGDADAIANPDAIVDAYEEFAASLSDTPEAARAAIAEKRAKAAKGSAEKRIEIAKRALAKHATAMTSLHQSKARLADQQQTLADLESQRKRGTEFDAKQEKQHARLTRDIPLRIKTLEKVEKELAGSAERFLTDPDLDDGLKDLIRANKPFLMDKSQRPIAIGAYLENEKSGTAGTVTALDPVKGKITVVTNANPLRPDMPGQSRTYDVNDVGPNMRVHAERPQAAVEEHIRNEIKYSGFEAMHGSPPATIKKHADAIQAALLAAAPTEALIVGRDGKVRYAKHSKGVEPDDGERFLLNTPEDYRAFRAAFPNDMDLDRGLDFLNARWLPFDTTYGMNEKTGRYSRQIKEPSSFAKAAEGGAPLVQELGRVLARLGIIQDSEASA